VVMRVFQASRHVARNAKGGAASRIEAPKAPSGVGSGEGACPSPAD
jgi:hypothetical protein